MDALIEAGNKADRKRRRSYGPPKDSSVPQPRDSPLDSKDKGKETAKHPAKPAEKVDAVVASISRNTTVPRNLSKLGSKTPRTELKVENNKFTPWAFQHKLHHQARWREEAQEALEDAEILKTEERGMMAAEGPMERTFKMTQDEIVNSIGEEQRRYRKEWKLDGGPYRFRHIAIAGKRGHVASFDWLTGKMHCELELRETCRDITYLNDHSHFAVAQKQHVYIYDQQGIELHRLREHIDITRLEYLPYHWLLVSVGNPGVLRYHDTSIGHVVATHKTKLGACQSMTQNPHNAVIYLGHQNGTVTLWTPNLDEPAVKLLAHLGGVTSLSVDPSTSGRYLATSGMDGKVKVWDCRNWKGCVREWEQRGTGHAEVEWSQKGFLGVASGGTVNVYTPPSILTEHRGSPPLYLTHPIPHRPLTSARFCPYTDMLTIGHANGLSSIIVPGAGEPTFDSSEVDPFESKKMRREREVHNLLDKIQPDLITLDPDFVGTVAEPEAQDEFADPLHVPSHRLPRWEKLKRAGMPDPGMAPASTNEAKKASGKGYDDDDMELGYSASDTSESEYEVDEVDHGEGGEEPVVRKKKKKSALKAYLKKAGGNVVDPTVARIKAKMEMRRKEIQLARIKERQAMVQRKPSALDRFRRPPRL
ncbi:Small subunit (SSU) processome component [Tulasnella sp. UAMH 9824]|nr:Small subunit (SSU) processome component [Tulasnella sp. UAMH 9824]